MGQADKIREGDETNQPSHQKVGLRRPGPARAVQQSTSQATNQAKGWGGGPPTNQTSVQDALDAAWADLDTDEEGEETAAGEAAALSAM